MQSARTATPERGVRRQVQQRARHASQDTHLPVGLPVPLVLSARMRVARVMQGARTATPERGVRRQVLQQRARHASQDTHLSVGLPVPLVLSARMRVALAT